MNREKYFKNPNSPFLLNIVQEGDGLELLRDLKDEVVQLVTFDPQYKTPNKATTNHHTTYFGNFPPNLEQGKQQIKDFVQQIERTLKPSGYLVFYISRDILLRADYHHYLLPKLTQEPRRIFISGTILLFILFCIFFRIQTNLSERVTELRCQRIKNDSDPELEYWKHRINELQMNLKTTKEKLEKNSGAFIFNYCVFVLEWGFSIIIASKLLPWQLTSWQFALVSFIIGFFASMVSWFITVLIFSRNYMKHWEVVDSLEKSLKFLLTAAEKHIEIRTCPNYQREIREQKNKLPACWKCGKSIVDYENSLKYCVVCRNITKK